jgi:hypothetical protein
MPGKRRDSSPHKSMTHVLVGKIAAAMVAIALQHNRIVGILVDAVVARECDTQESGNLIGELKSPVDAVIGLVRREGLEIAQ